MVGNFKCDIGKQHHWFNYCSSFAELDPIAFHFNPSGSNSGLHVCSGNSIAILRCGARQKKLYLVCLSIIGDVDCDACNIHKSGTVKCRHITNRSSSFRACGPPPDIKLLRSFTPLNSNVRQSHKEQVWRKKNYLESTATLFLY